MENNIGVFGELRRTYLRNHRSSIYTGMLLKGTLWAHLEAINKEAEEMLDMLTRQMKAREGITEDLKSRDQMEWVRRMNSVQSRARETVLRELIYS